MPDLSVTIGSLILKNPVLAAAGTIGYGVEFAEAVTLCELGGLITKTLTQRPREGNLPPRLAETPSGMLNAVGLQNIGLEAFLSEKLPALRDVGTPIIVSLLAESPEELADMVGAVDHAEGAAAIELNLSCPNIKHGSGLGASPEPRTENRSRFVSLVAHEPQAVERMVAASRRATRKPLIAKLSPDVTDLIPVAQAAERAGADAVALSNTYVGMSLDPETRRSRLGAMTGGLSGPAIRPLAVYRVWYTAQTLRVPVIGLGGILRAEDALEFLLAGASVVAVGTAHFADPRAAVKVVRGLERYCARHQLNALRELRGQAQPSAGHGP
ncbi:MAG: dihydroorotate dehydrogenase [Candidatus Omnitrophica bacterium]|nr:dihydroorotate dehydrogenase [Candidatus Omnitrophota bacterium]